MKKQILLGLTLLLGFTNSNFAFPAGKQSAYVSKNRIYEQSISSGSALKQSERVSVIASGINIGNDIESKALNLTLSEAALPSIPVILGIQAGDVLNTSQETAIGWEIPEGDVSDLFVFVEILDQSGKKVISSPELKDSQVLRANSTPWILPAKTLAEGQSYKVIVTFFKKVEDIVFKGVPTTIGTSSQTEVTVATSGEALRKKADQLETAAPGTSQPGIFQIKPATYSTSESAKSVNILISRTGGSAEGASVSFQTVDGSAVAGLDYVATNGTVVFKKGEGAKPVQVFLLDDTLADGTKTFQFKLVEAGGGASLSTNATATVTIKDNDLAGRIAFSSAKFSTNENAGTATITLKRTGGNASGVSVDYWTEDGTGIANQDYRPTTGTVIFGDKETTKTFTVPLINNTDASGDKTVKLKIGNFKGGGLAGTITNALLTLVNDDSTVSFTTESISGTEGSTISLTITRTGSLTSTGKVTVATVSGTATSGTDFAATNFTLVFPPKVASSTVKLTLLKDSVKDGGEVFHVVLRNPTGGIQLGAITDVAVKISDTPDKDAVPATGAPFFKFNVNGASYTSGAQFITGAYDSTSHFLVLSGTQAGKGLGSKTHMMLIQNMVVSEPGTYQIPNPTFAAVTYQLIYMAVPTPEPDVYTTLEGSGSGTIIIDVLDLTSKIATGRFDVTLPKANGTGSVHVTGSFRVPLKKV